MVFLGDPIGVDSVDEIAVNKALGAVVVNLVELGIAKERGATFHAIWSRLTEI